MKRMITYCALLLSMATTSVLADGWSGHIDMRGPERIGYDSGMKLFEGTVVTGALIYSWDNRWGRLLFKPIEAVVPVFDIGDENGYELDISLSQEFDLGASTLELGYELLNIPPVDELEVSQNKLFATAAVPLTESGLGLNVKLQHFIPNTEEKDGGWVYNLQLCHRNAANVMSGRLFLCGGGTGNDGAFNRRPDIWAATQASIGVNWDNGVQVMVFGQLGDDDPEAIAPDAVNLRIRYNF